MSVQAVIFDADGVLVFPWRFADHLSREYGITQDVTAGFFQHRFGDCLLGKADLMDALPAYLLKWGWPGSAEDFLKLWLDVESGVDGRMLGAVQDLRTEGLVCCLATNQEKHRAQYMKTTMGFAAAFDALFFSCELGASKPDPEFYRQVEAALGLAGGALLFWDDSPSHVEAARRRGWRAELFTDYEDFAQKMETEGAL